MNGNAPRAFLGGSDWRLESALPVGFVGAGKAGTSLGVYLSKRGIAMVGYYSRSMDSAHESCLLAGGNAFGSLAEIAEAAGLLILSVPDAQIEGVWQEIRAARAGAGAQGDAGTDGAVAGGPGALQGGAGLGALHAPAHMPGAPAPKPKPKYIAHMSGSLTSAVFAGAGEAGYAAGSIHPLLALHDKRASWEALASACFTIEGDAAFADMANALLSRTGNTFGMIAPEAKALYHAAAVCASNLSVATAQMSAELFCACGLPDAFADQAWRTLFFENAGNVAMAGPAAALTGPVERADAQTVSAHLAALEGAPPVYGQAYRALSLILAGIAEGKHPGRDYSELRALLGDGG